MAYRLITQKDVDKHPEWASMGISVNQMYDFPTDEHGNEIDDDEEDKDDLNAKRSGAAKSERGKPDDKPAAKPETPVSQASRSMREEKEAPEKPVKAAEKPAAKAEKPVTKNDAARRAAEAEQKKKK